MEKEKKKKKKKKKQAEKESRQQIASDWITENYLQWERLRVDTVRQRIQIMTDKTPSPFEGGAGGGPWSDLTDRDINDMVCQCCAETRAAVTSREVMTVLHSSMLPQVHPLRDYVNQQNAYDAQKEPNWIGEMADQVTLADTSKHELWRRCFCKWFIAMVASWLRDEAVNQQVLVLIGKQGVSTRPPGSNTSFRPNCGATPAR